MNVFDDIAERLRRKLAEEQTALYRRFMRNKPPRGLFISAHALPTLPLSTEFALVPLPWHFEYTPPRPLYDVVSDPAGLGDPVIDWEGPL